MKKRILIYLICAFFVVIDNKTVFFVDFCILKIELLKKNERDKILLHKI